VGLAEGGGEGEAGVVDDEVLEMTFCINHKPQHCFAAASLYYNRHGVLELAYYMDTQVDKGEHSAASCPCFSLITSFSWSAV
jgi:hypothetical protein